MKVKSLLAIAAACVLGMTSCNSGAVKTIPVYGWQGEGEDATEASRPFLETVKKKFGMVPNMFRLVSNSAAALKGHLGLADALSHGHHVGDMVIKDYCQRTGQMLRIPDVLARFGGEEFVVMLRDLSSNTQEAAALAQRIGEKILRGLSEPYVLRGHVHQGAASIGATLFGASAQSAIELLRQAFPTPQIAYWATPLLTFGRLGELP